MKIIAVVTLIASAWPSLLWTVFGLKVNSATQSSRNAFEYLKALQSWKAATRRGLSCPAPAACTCHCDCQLIKFEKPPDTSVPFGFKPNCPLYPVYPTLPPPPTTPAPRPTIVTPEPSEAAPTRIPIPLCAEGEVARADGTCSPITMEVINEMRGLVVLKKEQLDKTQLKYSTALSNLCAKCTPPMDKELLHDHEEYRKALDLFLAMLAMMKTPEPPSEDEASAAEEAALGPEFVAGEITGRVVCERWSGNATHNADRNTCGIICRHMPTCSGFAIDSTNKWCAWFKKLEPLPEDESCPVVKSQYVKVRNVTLNDAFWGAMEKIDAMEESMETFMLTADTEAQEANVTFNRWMNLGDDKKVEKDMMKSVFVSAKNTYTFTLQDAATIKEGLDESIQEGFKMIGDEEKSNAPFPDEEQKADLAAEAAAAAAAAATATTTTTTTPRPLEWGDFPNSLDTQWSQRHPECPQGPPCFCNCKCAGSPPQNFEEPLPAPPQPCPLPPPTPPPGRLSLPGGAPSLR